MTKEEIIDNIIYRQTDGEEYACLKKEDCMNAMQDYADQETERLKAELSEKDAEIERLEQEKIMLERYCSKYESELSELKERHKKDVEMAYGEGKESIFSSNPEEAFMTNEQYYKQKFEK